MATDNLPPAQPQASQPDQGMQIGIGAQYVKDLSFESPNAPQIFGPLQNPPELTINVDVHTRPLAQNTYEVLLALKVSSRIQDKTAFIAEIAYGGVLIVPAMPEEQLKMFLLVEGPRLLFPFARQILTNVIHNGGFPYIMINPVDFLTLYMSNKDKIGMMPMAGVA